MSCHVINVTHYPQLENREPRNTKIGTHVAHVARDSDTTFKVKRSKVNLQGAGAHCGGLPHSLFRETLILEVKRVDILFIFFSIFHNFSPLCLLVYCLYIVIVAN